MLFLSNSGDYLSGGAVSASLKGCVKALPENIRQGHRGLFTHPISEADFALS